MALEQFVFNGELDVGPSTANFLRKHPTLFDQFIHVQLRKGAPVVQMLEAPDDFVQGSAEPWIVDVLCALLKASDQRYVIECGAFIGATSLRLCQTLAQMGGGSFTAVEIEPERAATAQQRLEDANLPPTVNWQIVQQDIFAYLEGVPDGAFGFAWVDDTHTHEHVDAELRALFPKMVTPGGIICGHDVTGSCDLQQEFKRYGGIALDLPRLGPAGGIGILQL